MSSLENATKKICLLIGFTLCFYNSIETQNNYSSMNWQCDDGTSKENLHFDYQSKYVIFLLLSQYFLKEIENMFSIFLLKYQIIHSHHFAIKQGYTATLLAIYQRINSGQCSQSENSTKELKKQSWKFGRTQKSCGNTNLTARVPTAFLVLPKFPSCFY